MEDAVLAREYTECKIKHSSLVEIYEESRQKILDFAKAVAEKVEER